MEGTCTNHAGSARSRSDHFSSASACSKPGPGNAPKTDMGKLFAGVYALFAGLVFIFSPGILLAPLLHRLFHTLHWDR